MIDQPRQIRNPRRGRRAVALIVIVTLLGTLSLTPQRAEALNTAGTVGVVLGALAGYLLLVVIATAAVYGSRKKKPPAKRVPPSELTQPRPPAADGLRFASECTPREGQLPVLCW